MSLVIFGPRLLLERVAKSAGAIYTGINTLQECVVKIVGTSISLGYSSIKPGDRVLIRASAGTEIKLPSMQNTQDLILVEEEDVLVRTGTK